jgi:hypothetical protein
MRAVLVQLSSRVKYLRCRGGIDENRFAGTRHTPILCHSVALVRLLKSLQPELKLKNLTQIAIASLLIGGSVLPAVAKNKVDDHDITESEVLNA